MNTHPFTIIDYILVIGSYDGDNKDTVELVPLESGTGQRRLGKFPKKIRAAVGTTLGEFVTHSSIQPKT